MKSRLPVSAYSLFALGCAGFVMMVPSRVIAEGSSAAELYISDAKRKVQAQWHPHTDTKDGLLVTKVRLILNKSGKVKSCEISQASKSSQEDRAVQRFLKSFAFDPLPNNEATFNLSLTMMTDGRMNMVAAGEIAP